MKCSSGESWSSIDVSCVVVAASDDPSCLIEDTPDDGVGTAPVSMTALGSSFRGSDIDPRELPAMSDGTVIVDRGSNRGDARCWTAFDCRFAFLVAALLPA